MGDNNVPVSMVILGSDGHGKSSVGNFILQKITFAVSRADTPLPKRQGYADGNRGNFNLKVVDMPAGPIVPTQPHQDQLQPYRKMIDDAFVTCNDNLNFFVLVIKFEDEKTGNCLQDFHKWTQILEQDILKKRGIIVMTFGDAFTRSMETNQTSGKTFKNWCEERVGELKELFVACNWKIVLFDDTADLVQKENTFKEFSEYLRDPPYPYSRNEFKEFTRIQRISALQGESPEYANETQNEFYSLQGEIKCLQSNPSAKALLDMEDLIDSLTKKQNKLSEDQRMLLGQWRRDITHLMCEMSKTSRTLIKSAAGKMVDAIPNGATFLGLSCTWWAYGISVGLVIYVCSKYSK